MAGGPINSKTFERRIQNSVCSKTLVNCSSQSVSSERPCSNSSCERSSTDVVREESNRASVQCEQSGVLQSVLCSRKEGSRFMEVDPGFEQVKSLYSEGKVQDGVHGDDSQLFRQGSLGHVDRSVRCLLPYNDTSSLSEVHEVCSGSQSIPVQGHGNGSDIFSPSFHQGDKVCQSDCTQVQHKIIPVSRRLDGRSTFQGRGCTTHQVGCTDCTKSRFSCKCKEIRIDSDTGHCVSRLSLPVGQRIGKTMSRQMEQDCEVVTTNVGKESSSGSMAECHRSFGISGEIGTSGYVTSQTPSVGVERTMVTVSREAVGLGDDFSRGQRDCEMVVVDGKCDGRSAYSSGLVFSRTGTDIYGRQPRGLGGRDRRCRMAGRLVSGREDSPHKHVGAVGHLEDTNRFQRSCEGEMCHDKHRQYNSNVLSKETRRNKVKGIERSSCQNSAVVSEARCDFQMQTHCGQTKCHCGPVIKRRADTADRVVIESQSSGQFVDVMGQTNSGSICDKAQQEVDDICVTGTRSHGHGDRCVFNKLEPSICLCVSSNGSARSGSEEGVRRGLYSDFSSSSMAQATVVSEHSGSVDRHSCGNSNNSQAIETAPIVNVSCTTRKDEVTCLEDIQGSLKQKGFSSKVAKRMAEAQKPSTRDLYQRKWNIFRDWCAQRDSDPYKATIPLLADFFCELHEVKKYALSTIEGYRTAIGHVLKARSGLNVGEDTYLKSLFSNFARDVQLRRPPLPSWDLSLVLQCLTKEPFEPLKKVSMMMCTLKTVFLVSFATGKRRSEIHSLTRESMKRDENWESVYFSPDVNFVAKTELVNKGVSVLKEVEIKALGPTLGPDMQEDYMLCPVRALRIYLKRSDKIRASSQKKLFISVQEHYDKDISRNTVSGWLKRAVMVAYEHSSPDSQRLYRVKAHDVRALSASWAFQKNASMENIMQACSWRSHNTFTGFYLRDLTRIQGKMLSLGPVVAAQQRL